MMGFHRIFAPVWVLGNAMHRKAGEMTGTIFSLLNFNAKIAQKSAIKSKPIYWFITSQTGNFLRPPLMSA